ncbi:aminotransferase class V-fold PLP-dependent enzyme [Lewinella sp. W8]|uniref:aminotransferase class V-fold PLP-dependent enzyme n=1 Tax=Lewinella sp. W8 TaxID=2528208 RepID=UPI0010671C2D|nr:aminotransferase class V-fold PLP-dependent enzyme [Lewinella sp. W8]MTB50822.1 aminotransferase class V-fold PLP-dependent enzyme [Lewinella sp. W8]
MRFFSADHTAKFWRKIRKDYDLPDDVVYLENGYYNIMPRPVLRAFQRHVEELNRRGSLYMRTRLFEDKDVVAARVAGVMDCAPEELILTRNTTESMNTIISGLRWERGDEVILSYTDYGSMIDMLRFQREYEGVETKIVNVPLNPQSDQQILDVYAEKMSPKTRMILVPHIIHLTGQILPIKKLCALARERGIQVLVDGAHAVGQIGVSMRDLDCDFYGTSLHKWISAPLGCGALFVREALIPEVLPTYADYNFGEDDIKKLNHTGTHPAATDLTIPDAIDYYTAMGPQRKEDRLRELTTYWTSRVRAFDQVLMNTPEDSRRYCGIANFGMRHLSPKELHTALLERFNIWTVAIDTPTVKGVRVTLNVFNTFGELDQLVAAVRQLNRV